MRIKKIAQILSILIIFGFGISNGQNDVEKVYIAISNDIIGNVNTTDARAAMELWVQGMMSEISKKVQPLIPMIYFSNDELKTRMREKKADIIGMFSLDFIKLKSELSLDPVFIIQKNPNSGVKYVVIIKNGSKINSVSDLKSNKILTFAGRENEIVTKWLFVKMKKTGISKPWEIINKFIKVPSPNKRLLPVFFGKADGCILTKSQYESMSELNPQIKKQLKIVFESPLFLTQLYCVNKDSHKRDLNTAKSYVRDINNTANGHQMLKLFKIYRVKIFKQEYLNSIERLLKNYNHFMVR